MDEVRRPSNRAGPPAKGERRRWADLPEPVRETLEKHLRARVLDAQSEPGGFSPGVASRLRLSDGRRVFAKVIGAEPNLRSVDVHREEARVLAQMPAEAPVPKLLSVYDDGAWIALFLEEIGGSTPHLPWRDRELVRAVHAIEGLSALLTPTPFPAVTFAERHHEAFTLWREMSVAQRNGTDRLDDLDPWARYHLVNLAELEARSGESAKGSTLLHTDLRADNIVIAKNRVYFVDWPSACVGAPWVDLLGFLPSVAMQGGPEPWTIFDRSPVGREAEGARVDAVLAALTGYLLGNSRKPPPPGLSTLRPFQFAQGVHALEWLKHRLEHR